MKDYADKNNIELIFSPVYSPEFQPCESLIGFIKQFIKKKRLEDLYNGIEKTFEEMLKEA